MTGSICGRGTSSEAFSTAGMWQHTFLYSDWGSSLQYRAKELEGHEGMLAGNCKESSVSFLGGTAKPPSEGRPLDKSASIDASTIDWASTVTVLTWPRINTVWISYMYLRRYLHLGGKTKYSG